MECIDGVRLRDKLATESCTEHQRLAYLIQVGQALEHAHDASGIVHCDLKPENIMSARDGLVKILDFGLARLDEGYRGSLCTSPPASRSSGARAARRAEHTVASKARWLHVSGAGGRERTRRPVPIFSRSGACCSRRSPTACRSGTSRPDRPSSPDARPPPRLASIVGEGPSSFNRLIDTCLAKDLGQRWPAIADVDMRLQHASRGRGPRLPNAAPGSGRQRSRRVTIAAACNGVSAPAARWRRSR